MTFDERLDSADGAPEPESKREILITGGAGFIGAALAAELIRRGFAVTCLDTSDFRRLEAVSNDPRLRTVAGDVRDGALIDRCVAGAERVIHLAAVVGVDEYLRRTEEVLDVNIQGTRNVLDACARYGRPVLMASTSEVYGKNQGVVSEDSPAIFGSLSNSRWAYAISKAASEAYAVALSARGLLYVALRYFNVYGPLKDRPGKGRVISKFLGVSGRW